jgi:hypothetical protein
LYLPDVPNAFRRFYQTSHGEDAIRRYAVVASRLFLSLLSISDLLAYLIRAQNAGVIMRKFRHETVFESFEVSAPDAVVMGTTGKLLCSYPGPAIAIPQEVANNPAFQVELASFLNQMNVDVLDSAATTTKAKSTVVEERDSAHPRYITHLLTGILRGMGRVAEVTRIQKRIADDILWKNAKKPWRRSPLYLVIRVALQTSLHQNGSGNNAYKAFMVYMMARTLQLVLDKGFPSDLLFCMRGKISRRLYKMGPAAPDFVLQVVQKAGLATETLLQKRWIAVQNDQAKSGRWAPSDLDIPRDTSLSLPQSKSYISQVLQGNPFRSTSYTFEPNHTRRLHNVRDFRTFEHGLSKAFAADPLIALADFELAVSNHLDGWVAESIDRESACLTVAACITKYSEASLSLYASNPENQSTMLLTIFELWVALDKLCMAQCPLLREYSPEVPVELFAPLLLRRSRSFSRLTAIEEYVRERHRRAQDEFSIFTDDVDGETFAVRYFDTSIRHQSLRSRINNAAEKERQKKKQEIQSQNAAHEKLARRYESMEHESWINRRGRTYHSAQRCQRCLLEAKANNMEISVHEWPLPQHPLEAKVTVFELDCPVVFGVWRTTTYQVLGDICSPSTKKRSANPPVKLETYHGFQNYLRPGMTPRITLASTTKSFLGSHYKTRWIPCYDESSVCVNNGLQFRLYDEHQDAWATTPFLECSIVQYCTLQLPVEGPYKDLQYAVDTTSHTSNQVLANQSQCPRDLNLHEYIAFASLRGGYRLQWLNIARELRARSLSFHREEVHILLTQTACQIGHLSRDSTREWHAELRNAGFGSVLLQELEDLMVSIEANWLEIISVRSVIALASRLLASKPDTCIIDRVYALLRKARNVTFEWMHQLTRKIRDTEDEDKVHEFQRRVSEIAATCRGTYDVDPDHVPNLLGSPNDVAVLVECAIAIHDNIPSNLVDCPTNFKRLLDRDRRLSHSLEPSLRQRIREYRGGLDQAIASIWTHYRPGSDWQALEPPNDRWLISMTAAETGRESQAVQLDLLGGQLLINGKPLGRLPPDIVKHPTYSRIFGQVSIPCGPFPQCSHCCRRF